MTPRERGYTDGLATYGLEKQAVGPLLALGARALPAIGRGIMSAVRGAKPLASKAMGVAAHPATSTTMMAASMIPPSAPRIPPPTNRVS